MPYKILMRDKFGGSAEVIDDEIYETKADANYALEEAKNNFLTGSDQDNEDLVDYEFWIEKV